jgi:hypothetical protein
MRCWPYFAGRSFGNYGTLPRDFNDFAFRLRHASRKFQIAGQPYNLSETSRAEVRTQPLEFPSIAGVKSCLTGVSNRLVGRFPLGSSAQDDCRSI